MKKAKQVLSILLVCCLIMGILPATAVADGDKHPFVDVPAGAWYSDAVQYVYEHGLMNGTGTTEFSPDSTTSRGMVVTILHRQEGTPNTNGMSFTDVMPGEYYTDAVAWASANHIVDGYGNGKFGPDDPVNREQMMTILYRYAQYKKYNMPVTGSAAGFADYEKVSSYAIDALNWAVGAGLLQGAGGNTLSPDGVTTRAQTATILMRFCRDVAHIDVADSHGQTPPFSGFGGGGSGGGSIGTNPSPGGNADELHRVTFDLNDGSLGVYEVQLVKDGGKATAPSIEPERELYRFTGWYEERSGVIAYDFNDTVTSDLTLYAGWGNPDGSTDGLYAASNNEETIYSISGLTVDDTAVTATVNVNSTATLLIEFFEDTIGNNWTKEAVASLLSGDPANVVAVYTPNYGEMISVSTPVDITLPEYYIARARLLSSEGTDLCDPFIYIEASKQYAEFATKTADNYGQDQVVNFDQSITTNFGVLVENTKKITVSDTANKLTVEDVDIEDRLVPDHIYTFSSPDAVVTGLTAGDIVYIAGTQYLFKVGNVTYNQDGSIAVKPDNDAQLTDFYSTLKVDMGSASDDGIQPAMEVIDVNTSLSTEFGFPSVEFSPVDWLSVKWDASFKENLDIKIVYDAHLFSEDYFEFSLISKTTVETSAGIQTSRKDEEGNNPYKWQLLDGKGKVPIPTPIPGLEVYTKLELPVELKLSADISAKWKGTIKGGFTYNSYSGRNVVKDVEKTVELKAEGKAELTIGPEVAVGIQLSGGVVSAELNASGGVKATVTAASGSEDIHDTLPAHHACILCVSGEVKWFVEAHAKAEYDICKVLKGDLFDVKLFGVEGPVLLPGSSSGEFYCSIIPGQDSVFSRKNTEDPEFVLGGGTCPNIAYRTELKTLDESGAELTGVPINVKKSTGRFEQNETSACVTYLHDGVYTAKATLNGTDVSRSFVVKGNAQVVKISPSSGDKALMGKVVDSTDSYIGLSDASVKVSKDGLTIASAKSDENGEFSILLPEGAFLVEVTKPGYIPFTIYQRVESDRPSTQMRTITMIPGSGMGGFKGVITDAVTGAPIEGVRLQLRSGWENSSNGEVIKTLTTNSDGEFRYNTIDLLGTGLILGLACGNYTLNASKDGYIGTSFNITVLPGKTDAYAQQNAIMAPAQTQGDTWRIVLTWGENPEDVDAHVVGTLSSGEPFHVYFGEQSQYDEDLEVCNLDLDDVTSYGPETITLNANNDRPYYYYVHRFAGAGTLSTSNAQVKIYHGADPVSTFNVPTGLGDGDYWNLFAIADGKIKISNTITDEPDTSYAGDIEFVTTLRAASVKG